MDTNQDYVTSCMVELSGSDAAAVACLVKGPGLVLDGVLTGTEGSFVRSFLMLWKGQRVEWQRSQS